MQAELALVQKQTRWPSLPTRLAKKCRLCAEVSQKLCFTCVHTDGMEPGGNIPQAAATLSCIVKVFRLCSLKNTTRLVSRTMRHLSYQVFMGLVEDAPVGGAPYEVQHQVLPLGGPVGEHRAAVDGPQCRDALAPGMQLSKPCRGTTHITTGYRPHHNIGCQYNTTDTTAPPKAQHHPHRSGL